jgi:deoxyribonuclease (pyrimidine dimer)
MTRINLVHVKDLADQHLFAEWREIKMVPAALRRSLKTRNKGDILAGIPRRYTLNKGHVTFFFDKILFLYDRYIELTEELEDRGYALAYHDPHFIFFRDIPEVFWTVEWQPNDVDKAINIERILLRISEKPQWYRYYGEPTTLAFFEDAYST